MPRYTLKSIAEEGISFDEIRETFLDILGEFPLSDKNKINLTKIFDYASVYSELFPSINVSKNHINTDEKVIGYLRNWINKFYLERENPALSKPLKNYGEIDNALAKRVSGINDELKANYEKLLEAHYIIMDAENKNGATLEEFISSVLENHNWIWCSGSVLTAIDFCKLDPAEIVLLQVKNKYNTENSSSSKIRTGTEIKKWNRLSKPKVATGKNIPIPNWDELHKIISADDLLKAALTEDKYLEYIVENSNNTLATLE